ncbi:MAG: GAF domain-containing protein [Deltaproteobacteria bacterium]|nr:GAF domain-containing protein [Deltaproteobacteria bacterium]
MFWNYLRTSYAYVIPPILGFLVLMVLALFSLLRARRNPTNVLFAGICFLGAIINADVALVSLIPDKSLALRVDRFTYFFFVFSIPVYIEFVHAFLGISGRRWLEYLAYLFSLIFLFFTPSRLFISGLHTYEFGNIAKAGPVFHAFSAVAACTVFYCLITLLKAIRNANDNLEKNRMQYILGGIGCSAFFIFLNVLPVNGIGVYPMSNFSFIPALFIAYGVLKYDLLDIGAVLRKGTVYFVLIVILTILYVLIIYFLNAVFMGSGYGGSVLVPFALALLMVLLFNPARERVQVVIDRLFFRGKYDYQKLLRDVSGKMTSLLRFDDIKNLLLSSISEALQVNRVCLLIYGGEIGAGGDLDSAQEGAEQGLSGGEDALFYECVAGDGEVVGKNVFGRVHPIVAVLETTVKPLVRTAVVGKFQPVEAREAIIQLFDRLQASLIVPLISRGRLAGIIALGQKKSGELYVNEDMELLVTIANQSVIALENAKSYREIEKLNLGLERRVEKRTAALRRALEEKEQAQRKLVQSESLAAIGQLVAGVAHELNNPLASASSLIQTGVESIGKWNTEDAPRREVMDDLRFSLKELRRAGDIVRSLLDLSRQKQTYVEPVHINLAIDDALRVLYNQYKHLPVEIEKNYDEALPEVEGNFANLGQVFINVIKNALQTLPGGKGKITLATRYRKETDTVMIECRDTGKGIPGWQLKDIFKPFFTTKATGEGTGLGLYISHEIVKRHEGDISVTSEMGKGSVFTIELPCRRRGQ